jgi:hypothetical protein
MIDYHHINRAKEGKAALAFMFAVTPPKKPDPIATGRGGKKGGGFKMAMSGMIAAGMAK